MKTDEQLNTDLSVLQNGDAVILYPNENNMLHRRPYLAIFSSGYFFVEGSNPKEGPDYAFNDVLEYNIGFEVKNV